VTVVVPDIGLASANLRRTPLPELLIDGAECAGFRRITLRSHALRQASRASWTAGAVQHGLADAPIEVTMIVARISDLPGRLSSGDLGPNLHALLPIDEIEPHEDTFLVSEAERSDG
jgi:hypothetical protein